MRNYFMSLVFMAVVAPLFAQNDMAKTQTFPTDSIIYTCPMHPEIISGNPGKCPKCGMDLVQKNPASPGHEMNMMMCSMHGIVDLGHQHDERKKGNRKMMNGMGVLGITMGVMMVVMLIIIGGH